MKYMIMLYASQRDYDAMAGKDVGSPWTAEDFAAMGAFMEAFNKELMDSGELVQAQGLAAPAQARRLRLQGGVPVVTDGPYPETTEVLAGYTIIECESLERATEIAARLTACPGPEQARESAFADVRQLLDGRGEL